MINESLNFFPQLCIAATGFIEKRRALCRVALERGREDSINFLPALRCSHRSVGLTSILIASVSYSAYCGSPTRRRRSAKRGSERTLSHLGSVFKFGIPKERSTYALSSQAKAWSFSPKPA